MIYNIILSYLPKRTLQNENVWQIQTRSTKKVVFILVFLDSLGFMMTINWAEALVPDGPHMTSTGVVPWISEKEEGRALRRLVLARSFKLAGKNGWAFALKVDLEWHPFLNSCISRHHWFAERKGESNWKGFSRSVIIQIN